MKLSTSRITSELPKKIRAPPSSSRSTCRTSVLRSPGSSQVVSGTARAEESGARPSGYCCKGMDTGTAPKSRTHQPLELEVQAVQQVRPLGRDRAVCTAGWQHPRLAQGLAACCAGVSSVRPTSSMRRISPGVNGRAPCFVDSPAAPDRLVQASAASPSWSSR